jgi:thioredoxin reductase
MINDSDSPSNPRRVKLYGQPNSAVAYEIRDFLNRSVVEFDWIELASKEDCEQLRCAEDERELGISRLDDIQLTVVEFPDGTQLFAPIIREIAQGLGWVTQPKFKEYDLSIYGAGPAGLSAAVYAASEGLHTVLIERHFINLGLFYSAEASEAPMCHNEHVFVIGGGNSAGQAALYFSRYAKQVTMLVRSRNLAATLSQYLIDRITKTPNIEVLFNAQVTALDGDKTLRQITIADCGNGSVQTVETQRLFVCIGGAPNTEWAVDTNIIRDEAGYLITGSDLLKEGRLPECWTLNRDPFFLETSVPGSFAAGDVRHGSVKRVASAVGEGAMAFTFAHKYLEETR